MATTEAQKKATIKYMKENLEEVRFRVRKGKKKEYKDKATKRGMSLSAYIIYLLEKDTPEE